MRKLVWWSLIPVAAAGLAAAAWWLGGWHDARHWPIRWLEVSGELERVTAAQVRAAVSEQARRGFFAVRVERVRDEVEALPWVESAEVSRRWPDALEIAVREHRAVARWNRAGLISAEGELFEVAGTGGMQGLTRLSGPSGRQEEVVRRWREMASLLGPEGLEIRRVDVDPRGAWRVELGSGLDLLLGREQISARLERFLAVRGDLRGFDRVDRIDLRYPNGLALTRSAPDAQTSNRPDGAGQNDPTGQNEWGAQDNHG